MVKKFVQLGFSEYEAKASVALYEEHPATAYDVAKRSGVPSSKIYEVLTRLVEKSLVIELVEERKKRYVPADAHEFLLRHRERVSDIAKDLEKEILSIHNEDSVSLIVTINEYESLIQKANEMLARAKSHILLSTWPEEVENLAQQLSKKSQKMAIVHFGETKLAMGTVYTHPARSVLYNEKGGRQFSLVVDSTEALSATIYTDGHIEAAWSKNTGFIATTEDYIAHDIYIIKVANRFDTLLRKTYGEDFELLRDIYSDEVKDEDIY